MKTTTLHHVQIGSRRLDYRVFRSTAAKKLRIRVRPDGVEVVQPEKRNGEDVSAFVERNKRWILDQVRRMERLRHVRRPEIRKAGEILFRGTATRVRVEAARSRTRGSAVRLVDNEIVVRRGALSRTPAAQSLENWLRRQARIEIERQLALVSGRLRRYPRRIYVMGQRTKWGNCSAAKNLSFNWRLILAPDFVIRYLVTHEAVHLAIPDHSAKFWLTVQSLCRETERAKQWLAANGRRLLDPELLVLDVAPT
jgi:hypothetical protein